MNQKKSQPNGPGTEPGAGRRQRQGAGRGGLGSGGSCVCLRCGARQPHLQGMPCLEQRCPECGAALMREGSPRHRDALARRGEPVSSGRR